MNLKKKIKDELIKLIEIKRYNGFEREILTKKKKKIDSLGFNFKKIYINNDRYNLIIDNNEDFFICTHVDTVPIDKRELKIISDRIYGCGACDAKASIASILCFLEQIDELNFSIIFTVDEEGKGLGSEVIAKKYKFKQGIILEPTNLKIAIASAGSLEYELLIKGKQAHGSCIEEGENAIEKAFEFINLLKNITVFREYHPLIGYSNFLIEYIQGGSYELIVPDTCRLVIDFRILPNQDIERVKILLEDLFIKHNIEYKLIDISYPFETKDGKFISFLKKIYKKSLNAEPKIIGYKSWTDASNFFMYSNSSVAIFGPGDLKIAHTKDEHVDINEIIATVKFLSVLNQELKL